MRNIGRFISELFNSQNYNIRNFALFLLVTMCIQYIPLEGTTISNFKVAVMVLTIPVYLSKIRINKAFVFGMLYYLWIFFTAAILHSESFRPSTVLYLGMFFCTYLAFYTFVNSYTVLTISFFIKFLKVFISVLVIVLVLQQICIIVGIRTLAVINLHQFLDRGIGANSLSIEPSHFARLLLVLYYAYLKCNEYLDGDKITIAQILSVEHRWVTIAFLWAMLTMGSGTAFICLAILSFYFLRGWQIFAAIPIFIGAYITLSAFEVKQFERARSVVIATSTGDAQQVAEADGSATVRIKPLLNTLTIDLSKPESWIGEGCDSGLRGGLYSDNRYIGGINDYGLMAYIFSLVLIFSCAMDFRSLATIMMFAGIGGSTGNIAYSWGTLMIFTCVKHFHKQAQNGMLTLDDTPYDYYEEEASNEYYYDEYNTV